ARPPAYRLLHVPLTLAVGISVPSLRIVSFAGLLLALWLTYLTVSALAGGSAGMFAIIFIVTLPSVLGPVTLFGTEHPIYLGTAGTLWSLVRMQRGGAQRYGYLLLGCFVALGLLAKLTFATVLLPVLCVFATARAAGYIERPRITDLIKAMVLALLLAAPWYA